MEFYNSNHITTYQNIDDEDYSDVVYKLDMLKVFHMDENDDFELLSKRVTMLYKYLESQKVFEQQEFNSIVEKVASKIMSTDKETGFMMLFSFDTLYLIHKLIQNFERTKQIDTNIIQEINNKI